MPDAAPDPTSDTPPKKRRFRLRYSLRSLLLFMLLFSAAFALWGSWFRPRWQIEHILVGHGANVDLAVFSPDGAASSQRALTEQSASGTARPAVSFLR